MNIRILLVDDHAVVRSGLKMLIDAQPDLKVVGEAADGVEAIRQTLELKPHIVIMDLNMPNCRNGLYTTAELLRSMPEIKVIILTMHDDEEYLFQALKSGASGYVLKSSPGTELIQAIRQVYQGQAYLHHAAAKKVIEGYLQSASHDHTDAFQQLTDREKEILSLVAKGYTNKEVADLLSISAKTVENHKANIMDKLNLNTRRDLIRFAVKRGLLDFDD
ncbi:response regulator [Paenibacillus larvae]|uniref:Oxygen regulatory protein NreC n=1 Tax=Paenibacillus larvae subsp. larvae DSM 25430 TaxID=697284 RepID=V9WDD0_9BACL|nr:response regulator transcription factor [Paenibacillus larvae]AHD07725.1 oxygen regulatory protein NreC [Paenibacillus larvae subsp. larvae DSM 25430]AVG14286.1 oxygen regulatory protein NreC [Paenibacillus larvae subsp. larvae DSM 25430]MDR5567779.1 response regulator transcription factor [Paenibacillus larvae]MDR5594217.1 response regulator transcription factor [Paenibacillus larvae]